MYRINNFGTAFDKDFKYPEESVPSQNDRPYC